MHNIVSSTLIGATVADFKGGDPESYIANKYACRVHNEIADKKMANKLTVRLNDIAELEKSLFDDIKTFDKIKSSLTEEEKKVWNKRLDVKTHTYSKYLIY